MSDYEPRIDVKREIRETQKKQEQQVAAFLKTGDARSAGTKYDGEKEPLALLSSIWLLGVARVLAFGAKKYAADNWRKGIERRRLISAALRHLLAYSNGEDNDPETGLSHLDHASCCLMFIRETHETHPNLDDRYKRSAV